MFEWSLEGVASLFLIVVVCGIIAAFGSMMIVTTFDLRTLKGENRLFAVTATCVFALLVGAIQGISLLATRENKPDAPEATAVQAAAKFGLESGKTYPLLQGTAREAPTDRASFYADTYPTGDRKPVLAVGFAYQGKSYVLRLPPRKVTFVRSDAAESSITMYLKDAVTDDLVTTLDYPDCNFVFRSLVAMCSQPVTDSTTRLTADAKRRGLAPLVARYLDSVTITLPKSGKNDPLL